MKMMKIFTAIIMATLMLSMTACGNDGEKNDKNSSVETTLPVDAEYTDLGGVEHPSGETTTTTTTVAETKTTEDTTGEPTETTEAESGSGGSASLEPNKPNPNGDAKGDDVYENSVRLVPETPITVSGIDFGKIKIVDSGDEISLFEGTYADVYGQTGWLISTGDYRRYLKFEETEFNFYGNFCEGKGFPVYLELLEDDMVTLATKDERERMLNDNVVIKGMAALTRDAENQFKNIEFYGGITLRMSQSDIEAIVGEGVDGETFLWDYQKLKETEEEIETFPVIYKSETSTMVVFYCEVEDILTGETYKQADKIFVIEN